MRLEVKIGMELRSGQVTAVGCTERIRHLNEMLHQSRPNLELHRTRVFTKYFKEHESASQISKRYGAMAEVYRSMPIFIVEGERLLDGREEKSVVIISALSHMHTGWNQILILLRRELLIRGRLMLRTRRN